MIYITDKTKLAERGETFYHQMVYSMFYWQLGSVRMCKPPRASCSKGAGALETIGTIVMVKGFPMWSLERCCVIAHIGTIMICEI